VDDTVYNQKTFGTESYIVSTLEIHLLNICSMSQLLLSSLVMVPMASRFASTQLISGNIHYTLQSRNMVILCKQGPTQTML